MGAENVWKHPAFFDYVDRWMSEDDTQAVAEIYTQTNGKFDYSADWDRQGQTRYWLQGEFPQNTFIDDMWHAYRGLQPSQAPTATPTGGGGGGCFIATAAYGSAMDSHVVTLRDFRDKYLLTHSFGRKFVKIYYRYSPPLALYIGDHEMLRIIVRMALVPIIYFIEYPALPAILFISLISIAIYRRKKLLRN